MHRARTTELGRTVFALPKFVTLPTQFGHPSAKSKKRRRMQQQYRTDWQAVCFTGLLSVQRTNERKQHYNPESPRRYSA